MIKVENLTKRYAGQTAIQDLNFEVGKGEIMGFLGPNGAGKSTTMRILSSFMPPTSGRASIAGFDIFEQSLQARAHLGYMPENVPLYNDMRVTEYLDYRAALKGVPHRRVAERVGDVKRRAGHEEEVCLERAGFDLAGVRAGRGLERTHGRGAHRHDAPPLALSAIHVRGGVRGDVRALEVHPVLFDASRLHGSERAEADVQRHARHLDAPRRRGGEQLLREVEARGRRRDRAGAIREDGLVVDRVLRVRDAARAADVGRKRRGTEGGDCFEERGRFAPVLLESKSVKASFEANGLGLPSPFKEKLPPGLHPPSRLRETAPKLLSPFRSKIRNPRSLRNP